MKMQRHPAEHSWADYALPDASGHFGPYGGVFVAETLRAALDDLAKAYEASKTDPEFQAELAWEYEHFVGRPDERSRVAEQALVELYGGHTVFHRIEALLAGLETLASRV